MMQTALFGAEEPKPPRPYSVTFRLKTFTVHETTGAAPGAPARWLEEIEP